MASAQSSSVPRLMASVKQLTPAELRDFTQRLLAWQLENGELADGESELVQVCQLRLPERQEQRLRTLIGKSERGKLRPEELAEYRELVRHAEKLDATRLAALAQLARLWKKPVSKVMKLVGWEVGDDGATRHPSSSSTARARSRR